MAKTVVEGRASRKACSEGSRRVQARVDRRSGTERTESLVDRRIKKRKESGE